MGTTEKIQAVQITNVDATAGSIVAELWETSYEEGKPDRILYELRLCDRPDILYLTGRRYLVVRPAQ